MTSESDHVSGTVSKPTQAENTDTNRSSPATNDDVLTELRELKEQVTDNSGADDIEDQRPKWMFKQFKEHWKADDKVHSALQPYESAWRQFCEWTEKQGHMNLPHYYSCQWSEY